MKFPSLFVNLLLKLDARRLYLLFVYLLSATSGVEPLSPYRETIFCVDSWREDSWGSLPKEFWLRGFDLSSSSSSGFSSMESSLKSWIYSDAPALLGTACVLPLCELVSEVLSFRGFYESRSLLMIFSSLTTLTWLGTTPSIIAPLSGGEF